MQKVLFKRNPVFVVWVQLLVLKKKTNKQAGFGSSWSFELDGTLAEILSPCFSNCCKVSVLSLAQFFKKKKQFWVLFGVHSCSKIVWIAKTRMESTRLTNLNPSTPHFSPSHTYMIVITLTQPIWLKNHWSPSICLLHISFSWTRFLSHSLYVNSLLRICLDNNKWAT
jgi:hypothetical protein